MKKIEYVHSLSDTELVEIQKAIKTHVNPRVRVRAIMIRLSHEKHSAPKISEMLGCSRQTVLSQIYRYEQDGILGLEDKSRSGAPTKADVNYIEQLRKAVSIDPPDLGYRFSVWSVERLQKHLIKQTGIELAPNYLNELMKRHGIVYRRPKHDLSDKQEPQEVDEKKELLEFLPEFRPMRSIYQ